MEWHSTMSKTHTTTLSIKDPEVSFTYHPLLVVCQSSTVYCQFSYQRSGFLPALKLPPPIETGRQEIAQNWCLKVVLKHQKSNHAFAPIFSIISKVILKV